MVFIQRYAVLLIGLDVGRMGKWTSIMIPTVNFIRRLLMAISVTLLYSKSVFCIFTFNFITLFYIMFFAWHMPNQSKKDNYLQLMNEVTVMFVNYHLFCFTRFVGVETQVYVGNSVILVVMGIISINFLVIFWSISTKLIRFAKRKYAIIRNKKKVEN